MKQFKCYWAPDGLSFGCESFHNPKSIRADFNKLTKQWMYHTDGEHNIFGSLPPDYALSQLWAYLENRVTWDEVESFLGVPF